MSLLQEVAILPDVFLELGYSQPGFCSLCLGMLQQVLLEEAVIRDLRNGSWSRQFSDDSVPWQAAAQKLLKVLAGGNRLVPSPAELKAEPTRPVEWGWEAEASHCRTPLSAILSGNQTYVELGDKPHWCCAETVCESGWWQSRSPSVRLKRTMADYLRELRVVLRSANSLMFIDPHLDPSYPRYSEFYKIVEAAKRQEVKPQIELHRACYDGSGPNRNLLKQLEVVQRFASLHERLRHSGLRAEVFVWDDLHERYLISNLIGIHLGNGFDTSRNRDQETTWGRLSPRNRDDIQREHDPASKRHELRFQFPIGI